VIFNINLILTIVFTIVIFAAACMTLELAEFGKPFITSIVNGSDIVPTLSACSVHDFIDIIVEVTTYNILSKYLFVLVRLISHDYMP